MDKQDNAVKKVENTGVKRLKLLQENYIEYKAVGGLITSDDGAVSKMNVEDFANKIGVNSVTLWRWQKLIPNFEQRVEAKRNEIFTTSRVTAVWNGVYLRALRGDAEQAKLFLGTYAKWQPPAQKHEVRVSGLADLAKAAETKKIIEGEITDGNNT